MSNAQVGEHSVNPCLARGVHKVVPGHEPAAQSKKGHFNSCSVAQSRAGFAHGDDGH
jgi:hypothetical protein